MAAPRPETDHAEMKRELAEVRADIQALRTDVQDLVSAWKTATGVVKFVKWLSTLMAAMAVIYATLKGLAGR
jgi:hypothetical protein